MSEWLELERLLSPELLVLLDEHVREVALEAVRDELTQRGSPRRWLTLAEAAEEHGCSVDAMRMRVARGTVQARRQGRRLYVSAQSLER